MKRIVTAQEMFDAGWQAFVVEGRPWSLDISKDLCRYRGPNGAKCLGGLMIDDDDYDPRIEEQECGDAFKLIDYEFDDQGLTDEDGSELYEDNMQIQLHDVLYVCDAVPGSPEVKYAYVNFANRFGLTIPNSSV